MNLTLYYVPNTRATRVRWMLEELGVPHAIHRVDVKAGEHRTNAYRAEIHPLGHVPALRVDGRMMFESQAICLFLADAFSEKGFAPRPTDPARGEYLSWMAYSVAELEAPLARWNALQRRPPEERAGDLLLDEAKAQLHEATRVIEERLVDRPYLLGERFGAADLLVASVLGWARMMKLYDADRPILPYIGRCFGREAWKRARSD